jgi:hypothetical protein
MATAGRTVATAAVREPLKSGLDKWPCVKVLLPDERL